MKVQPFKTLLFGFAFSPSLKANVFEAMRLAYFLNARLILVHVGEKNLAKEKQCRQLLESCELKPEQIEVHWKTGKAVTTLLNACTEYKVDLLLLGALKRENVLKFYLGSIARKLTRKAQCSVMLMLNPSVDRVPCQHIVVNGFESPQTQDTIIAAFKISQSLKVPKVTLVEEISESRIAVSVDDDRSLRKATLEKEKINRAEKIRVQDIIKEIPESHKKDVNWNTQSIFGRRGYSIGHYARVVRADLLVMNAQEDKSFLQRFFPKDLEHILTELPTNVLIVNSTVYG